MTTKQKQILKDLERLLWITSRECESSNEFNDFVARLNIFNADIYEAYDKMNECWDYE